MGEDYARNQELALGLEKTPLVESCDAALALFLIAVAETSSLLDHIQGPVVKHASELADRRS
jgi:hypothetical protein